MPIKRAVALGFFDGIHLGHAALLGRLVEVCRASELSPAVISFDTLPQNFLYKKQIPLINTPEDRAFIISRSFNIDSVLLLRFDEDLAAMPWDAFIDMLVCDYNAQHIITGSNFRFGNGISGNSKLLRDKCLSDGIGCDIVGNIKYDGVTVSSTYIRDLLLKGNVEQANAFLGHAHILTGAVRCGQKLGSKLGAPTLNLFIPAGVLVPAHGVYATKLYAPDCDGLPAVTNIGIRPTVDDCNVVTVETHIPGSTVDLYGQRVCVEFYKYLRPEKKFENIEELKKQIKKDCDAAVDYFNNQEKDYN